MDARENPQVTAETPDVKRIVGALILGSDHPVSVKEIRAVLEAVEAEERAEAEDSAASDEELFAASAGRQDAASDAPPPQPPETPTTREKRVELDKSIRAAVAELRAGLRSLGLGMDIAEIADGYRLQTDPACGPWVRRLLNRGKPQRMSRPVIETLAIIAYRQPISRSEIESIRGVGVGHVLKALMEMQLVRIVGRSDLPGKPFLFGTTPVFLDHFGLRNLGELNHVQPGVERTPPAEQRARHVRFSFKGSATDAGADSGSAPAATQPDLPLA